MALLDRLRPQPAWKHADPAVRLASLDSLTEAELGVIATLARSDDSPRVRRAAIARLADADVLGTIARNDVDAQVRADALARLLTLALDGTDLARAALAARSLREERALVQVARSAPAEDIALAALERLQEQRALGSVARHSTHDAVRARALERITDPAELEAVAVTTEHNDTGVAAVDRLGDTPAVDVIAERARNPVVARRARAFVRVREQRAADAKARADAAARRRALLTEGVDALEHATDPARARAELGRLEEEFAALTDATEEETQRFADRVAAQRARLDAVEQAQAAAAAERAARDAGLADREALIACAAEDAEDIAAHLADLRAVWEGLQPLAGGDDGSLARRFAEALRQAEQRHEARARAAAVHDQVVALVEKIEALAAPEAAPDDSERAWPALHGEWQAFTAPLAVDAALAGRVAAVEAVFASRRAAREAELARTREQRIEAWRELGTRAVTLAASAEAPIREVDQTVRELKAVLEPQVSGAVGGGNGGGAAAGAATGMPESLAVEMRAALAALSTRLRELRDAEDWRRWANAGIQEALVTQVEALKTSKDLPNVARQLRDLRRQWKAVSAGRDEHGALWQRFKSAADELQARCDEQARLVAAEQAVHVAARVALCEQAEALAQSTDWVATAETLKQLQSQWAATGPAPRDQVAELARRFRSACDTFFTRRKADLASLKQAWSENAAKKEALCVQAEALAESTNWQAALTGIKQLQAEWKAVGPVRRNRAELLWKRFRAACDRFFERYGQRHQIAQQQRVEERAGVVTAIEAVAAEVAGGTVPEGIAAAVQDLWTKWQNGAGLAGEELTALRARFDAALHAIVAAAPAAFSGSRFDVSAQVARRTALIEEVETAVAGPTRPSEAGASPAATLAALLRESLAANTIGGRVNEDAKLRVVADKVRRAQQQWRDLGPAFGEAAAALEGRFHHAVRRFFDRHPELRNAPSGDAGRGPGGGHGRPDRPRHDGPRHDGPRGGGRGPGGPGAGRGPRPEGRGDREPRAVPS
jgi:hypothetical protein